MEVRCARCLERHARRPSLLATIRGAEILVPVRLGSRKAKEAGVARSGLFWKKPAEQDGYVFLRCRRCHQFTRTARNALERAAGHSGATVLYLGVNKLTVLAAS